MEKPVSFSPVSVSIELMAILYGEGANGGDISKTYAHTVSPGELGREARVVNPSAIVEEISAEVPPDGDAELGLEEVEITMLMDTVRKARIIVIGKSLTGRVKSPYRGATAQDESFDLGNGAIFKVTDVS